MSSTARERREDVDGRSWRQVEISGAVVDGHSVDEERAAGQDKSQVRPEGVTEAADESLERGRLHRRLWTSRGSAGGGEQADGDHGASVPRDLSGSLADLGVLVPIAIALIVRNGLSPTAVLLPAGLAYLLVARVYRVPVAVQPLKAFGAIAIAAGAGPDVIAAGALLMGAIFVALGVSRVLGRVAGLFPIPVIRGVQLAVALTFLKIAWTLVADPPKSFESQVPPLWVGVGTIGIAAALLVWRRGLIIVVVTAGLAVALARGWTGLDLGPSAISFPTLSLSTFATALTLLVIPQLPLTFANSCLAPADAARAYFGAAASRVTPDRLAVTLGAANLFAGAISGMPVCHGAGGMSAHYTFGARTGRAPATMGVILVGGALVFGAGAAATLAAFPLSILAALLVVAALAHAALLRDLRGIWPWCLALAVGIIGISTNIAWGVAVGLAASVVVAGVGRFVRPHTT